ncbi:hypothetical protein Strain138_001123 [Pseudogemmatithrix spongiicola]|uniref:Uncharacterized protein n=1 Tax=Pseudogemmatithrix spongiicola TaxID=3062599 RepID=A0AA49JZK4_9BACT|nr:hypothetical protein Strain138_001123 [Gemmatimonadaceae bacterium 'strain 138']WKW14765.1 hypothetical protein Strain318_001123 [Gemmatimonadaceae bacterium 'strain 318']
MPKPRGTVPLQWHVARWRIEAPGRGGLLALAALTLFLCVPLERLGADMAWSTQANVLVNLGVTLAAVMFGRDAGRSDDAEPWLALQGGSGADWALARWAANTLPLFALAGTWAFVISVVSRILQGPGVPWHGTLGLAAHLALTAIVLTLLLLAFGALGIQQTAEAMLLVLILTFSVPLLGERLPTIVRGALGLILPPMTAIAAVRDGVVDGDWGDALRALLRLVTWCGILLTIALGAADRRVPARPSRKPRTAT